jgi:hypothetical protein
MRFSAFALAFVVCLPQVATAKSGAEVMLAKPPKYVYVAPGTALDVEGCLGTALASIPGNQSIVHGSGRTHIIINKGAVIVSVVPSDVGVRVEVRRTLGNPSIGRAIERCGGVMAR